MGGKMPGDLPRLIFFENHADPTNTKLLTLLVPTLKMLGYQSCYHELPSNLSLADFGKNEEKGNPYFGYHKFNFLRSACQHSIEFKPIDIEKCYIPLPLSNKDNFREQIYMPLRDQAIISAYLETRENVFGWNGIAHAVGMQKLILKYLSREEAQDNFIFLLFLKSGIQWPHRSTSLPTDGKKVWASSKYRYLFDIPR
jgi:hypothetical protein